MDPLSELTRTILDGVDQGTARVVTIGTSAAAAAAWNRVRAILRGRRHSLELAEREALVAEPGEEVDRQAMLGLLRMLSPEETTASIMVRGDYVARDKNQVISVQGDYIGRDKN